MIRSWVLGNEAHENRNGVLLFYLLCVSEKYKVYYERSDLYEQQTSIRYFGLYETYKKEISVDTYMYYTKSSFCRRIVHAQDWNNRLVARIKRLVF